MSSSNDNPLKQFAAFWFVLGLSLVFLVLALLLTPMFNRDKVSAADKSNASRRLEIRKAVDTEQAAKLKVAPESLFENVAAQLVNAKPVSVQEDRHRDPAAVAAEAAAASEEATPQTEESAN